MLCDDCREKMANVHITKINNGEKIERHLCDKCAQKSGEVNFANDAKFSVQDFLKGMFSHDFTNIPQTSAQTHCPSCGMTYNDFSRSGKVGCSECYAVYGERFEPLVRRIHGTGTHTGKMPQRSGNKLALKRKLRELRRDLERHVAQEEYEQAAKVRDEIKSLERQLAV